MRSVWFLALAIAIAVPETTSVGLASYSAKTGSPNPSLLFLLVKGMAKTKRQSDSARDLRWLAAVATAASDSHEQRAAKSQLANAIRLRYGMTRPRLGR